VACLGNADLTIALSAVFEESALELRVVHPHPVAHSMVQCRCFCTQLNSFSLNVSNENRTDPRGCVRLLLRRFINDKNLYACKGSDAKYKKILRANPQDPTKSIHIFTCDGGDFLGSSMFPEEDFKPTSPEWGMMVADWCFPGKTGGYTGDTAVRQTATFYRPFSAIFLAFRDQWWTVVASVRSWVLWRWAARQAGGQAGKVSEL
jgi:hypothetical protein